MNDWKGLAEVAKLVEVYKAKVKTYRSWVEKKIAFEEDKRSDYTPRSALSEFARLRAECDKALKEQDEAGRAVLDALERC